MGGVLALNELVDLALHKLREVIQIPSGTVNSDDLKLYSMQKDAAVAVVNTAVKVDETRLRARTENSLARLMEKINRRRLTAQEVQ